MKKKTIFKMSNREFNIWLWHWFRGWAIATAIVIVLTSHAHGAFTLTSAPGATIPNEGTSSGTTTTGVTSYDGWSFWSWFSRWMM